MGAPITKDISPEQKRSFEGMDRAGKDLKVAITFGVYEKALEEAKRTINSLEVNVDLKVRRDTNKLALNKGLEEVKTLDANGILDLIKLRAYVDVLDAKVGK